MWIKIIVVLAMLAVLFSLFTALAHLTRGEKGHSEKTLKFLAWRLVFSIAIIVGLCVASFFGLITPHGLPQVQQAPPATTTAP